MTMNRNLGYFQIGKETVHGTAVPATERILVEDDLEYSDDDNIVWRPNLRRGTLVRHPGNEVVIRRGVRWSIPETPMQLEQFQRFLAMSIRGGVTPTTVVPAPAGRWLWTFVRSLTAIQDIDTFTLERRASDGSTNKDLIVPYCFVTKITLKGAADSPVTYAIEGVGRAPATSGSITAGLTNPATGTPSSYQSALYFDNTFGAIGGTLVSNQILSWELVINPGWMPFSTLQGQQTLDFGTHKLNPDNFSIELKATALLGAQYDIERTAARAQSMRYTRLAMALDPTTDGRGLNVDMALKHEAADILHFAAQDGQEICDFSLVESGDDAANILNFALTNKAAA